MEQIEMIEKLREKADVTYDEAKGILESVNWNLLDAMIALEKEGKLKETKTMSYSTRQEKTNYYDAQETGKKESALDVLKRFFEWCGNILVKGLDNKLCITKEDKMVLEIPVTIAAIIAIFAFIPVVVAIIIAFFAGCRFSMSGPELGTDKVNDVLSRVKFDCNVKDERDNTDIDERK